MKRIWMLRAAGILCIIAGVPIVVIACIVVVLGVDALIRPSPDAGYVVAIFILFAAPLSILSIILGTFAIVGGINALRRRRWGLALAGSICVFILGIVLGGIGALFYGSVLFSSSLVVWPFVVFGILGLLALLPLIFVILGKREFHAQALVSALYSEESADAHYKRGDACDETGEYDKAITNYSRAIELDANHALSYYNRGCAYGEIGEYEKAVADFNKAVELDPSNASAYYNRGLAYHEKGKIPEAVSDLEKCIELSTDPGLIKDAKQALFEMGHSSKG